MQNWSSPFTLIVGVEMICNIQKLCFKPVIQEELIKIGAHEIRVLDEFDMYGDRFVVHKIQPIYSNNSNSDQIGVRVFCSSKNCNGHVCKEFKFGDNQRYEISVYRKMKKKILISQINVGEFYTLGFDEDDVLGLEEGIYIKKSATRSFSLQTLDLVSHQYQYVYRQEVVLD
ncbi:MAG: hypothetical protein ACR2MS_07825 [Weeksellaceae bacterium]